MQYDMTVVIASLNGEARIESCLRALDKQTIGPFIEKIVVDDGSADDTSKVARENGARVLRHLSNQGVAAARNTGAQAASASIVAFLDDDCEPDQEWAERLLLEYTDGVVGVGGAIHACSGAGIISSYLRRRNRHEPLELDLAKSEKIPYRFYLYVRKQWAFARPSPRRNVYAFVTAGGFDERFRDGAEEQDFCRRLLSTLPGSRLVFVPEASVVHYFDAKLYRTLKRNYAYGRGAAKFYRKWPTVRLTIFPGPFLLMAVAGLAFFFPELLPLVALIPYALYPMSIHNTIVERRLSCLLDSYLQLAQELWENVGFITGLWTFRHFPVYAPKSSAEVMSEAREPRGSI
jgi:glycosyltransferase involved in cell wall biosynthesis